VNQLEMLAFLSGGSSVAPLDNDLSVEMDSFDGFCYVCALLAEGDVCSFS
jgi:hypothetical protein